MDVRLIWTDCDEVGDYVVPNVLSQRDLVPRPVNMDETVLHTLKQKNICHLNRNHVTKMSKYRIRCNDIPEWSLFEA